MALKNASLSDSDFQKGEIPEEFLAHAAPKNPVDKTADKVRNIMQGIIMSTKEKPRTQQSRRIGRPDFSRYTPNASPEETLVAIPAVPSLEVEQKQEASVAFAPFDAPITLYSDRDREFRTKPAFKEFHWGDNTVGIARYLDARSDVTLAVSIDSGKGVPKVYNYNIDTSRIGGATLYVILEPNKEMELPTQYTKNTFASHIALDDPSFGHEILVLKVQNGSIVMHREGATPEHPVRFGEKAPPKKK